MQEWKPLSAFEDLLQGAGEEIPVPSVYQGSILAPVDESKPPVLQAEPAWERRVELGFFSALVESIKQVLTNPSATFAAMPRDSGFFTPLLYSVILTWMGVVVSSLYQIVYALVNPAALEDALEGTSTSVFVTVFIGIVIFMPVFLVAAAFISSAFMHFFLWVMGGAKRPYETTFRVICYTQGSTAILQLIPICGGFASTIWYFYCAVVGLAKAHETETWRVIVAVLLPVILFCGFLLTIISLIGGAAIMRAAGA